MDQSEPRVLVVDDEEVVHASLRKVLSSRGYQVDAVYSAQEALERIGTQPFDLVITDLMMPGMNGIELMHRLRERGLQLPVIMITGYPTIRTAVQAMRLGARDYISKPFTRKELLGPVIRALNQEAEPAPPESAEADTPLMPGVTLYLPHHCWARFQQDGLFLVGIERSFLDAVGHVVAIDAPEENDLVEQGAVAIRLTNEAKDVHGVVMPLSGQVVGVNQAALKTPAAITAETGLIHLLPSHLDDELSNLRGRY